MSIETSEAEVTAAEEALARAVEITAATVGELMGFWGFKPSMGRVWAVLYLSQLPLHADELQERTGLSAGSISMTIKELEQWHVVRRVHVPGDRRRAWTAENDILAMVTRVFRERELRLVREASRELREALRLLDDEAPSSSPESMMRVRFVATRVRHLLDLARTGERIVERLSRSGNADLSPLKGWLTAVRRTGRA